jgi:hypothetical protein
MSKTGLGFANFKALAATSGAKAKSNAKTAP